jgi:hypothetical protein
MTKPKQSEAEKPKQTEAEQIAEVDKLLTMVRSFLTDVLVIAILKARRAEGHATLEDIEPFENDIADRQLLLVQAIAAAVRDR